MLSVDHLTYTYPGNPRPTLHDLSFTMGEGDIFGFLGPSGSGKSTTQKILYRLLSGYQGQINFDGRPLPAWGREFYQRIGVSFELPNHYLKLSARENLQFFGSFYRQHSAGRIEALLDRVGLLPDADKRVSEFSKGMKMRLNFVRALLHDPDVLFLDEPTSGLDPINAKVIKDMIRELREQGKTIFLTTHNMFDADQLCDRVALLDGGVIQALDRPATLKLRYGRPRVRITLRETMEEVVYDLDHLGENPGFQQILAANAIQTIHSEEATLEDVFIQITGKRLV